MFVFVCEWCNKIKEGKDPERDAEYERDKQTLSAIDFMCKYSQPTTHYICAECLHKVLKRDSRQEHPLL